MPYIVTNSDGTLTVTVSDNTVDTASYSLALVGRSVSNYGQYFAQNTIRHLENFASATAPSTPITGQIWYDKTEKVIRVYDGVYWKRMGIVVGANNTKPTTQLAGGGTAFFNTTNNKLEVHNGTNFKDAGYAGEVTSAYSANTDVDSPTFYGTRLRTLFLSGTYADDPGATPRPFPVLALMSVKTSSTPGAIRTGITEIGEQNETIMALWSDFNFIIASNTQTPVDGEIVDFSTELKASGGIAGLRSGRSLGEIKQGLNTREEYEESSVIRAEQIYVTHLGSSSERVQTADFETANIYGLLSVTSLSVENDITVDNITLDGDLTAATGIGTFANLVVTANTTLSGITHINGNLVVNGVNTQSLGTDAEKIETGYFDSIDAQTIVVDDEITTANITVSTILDADTAAFNNLTVTVGPTDLVGSTDVDILQVDQTLNVEDALTANGAVTVNNTTEFNSDVTVTGSSNVTISGTGYFDGAATQVKVNETDANNDFYLSFFGDDDATASPKQSLYVDTELKYNPNTDLFTASNITVGTTLTATAITAGAEGTAGTITGQWTLVGTSTLQATYADLGEKYLSDEDYEGGTVVKLGGSAEITKTATDADPDVFGVVSTDPAYIMNAGIDGTIVALQGRVPVKVLGTCSKGDRLVSSGVAGFARAIGSTPYDPRIVIGRALANKTHEGEGTVEAVIGVK